MTLPVVVVLVLVVINRRNVVINRLLTDSW